LPITIGRYKLLRRIAIGGMAEIYLAAVQGEAGFERKVIIKKILPLYARESEFVRRLVDEGLLASRLTHGNIVQVLDLGRLGPDYFIAMEFVDGVDLRELLSTAAEKQFTIPIPIGIHVLWQAARGLAYAHDKKSNRGEPLNIVHRDISPANIFISWEGAVKLGDFGIAKASQRLSRGTMAGVLQGKFPYMSPEQAEGMSLGQRSDIFSFGAVAYELMTQRRPFQGESDLQTLSMVQEGRFVPLTELRPELPPEFEEVVNKCLQKDPEDRYSRGEELAKELAILMQKRGWVVSEGDVADFLTILYGDDKRSLAAEVDASTEPEGEIVEASPLDPYNLRAGLPDPVLMDRSQDSQGELTRAVTSPAWQRRSRKSSALWIVWSLLMLLFAGALLADYFVFHLFFGAADRTAVRADGQVSATAHHDIHPVSTAESDASSHSGSGRAEVPPTPDSRSSALSTDVAAHPGDAENPGAGTAGKKMLHPSLRPDAVQSPDMMPEVPSTADAVSARELPRTDDEKSGPNNVEKKSTVTRLSVLPTDTIVFVDNQNVGEQPQRIVCHQGERARKIRLEREGYGPSEFELSYPAPRRVAKRLQKTETGYLEFRYFPAAATVRVDDRPILPKGSMNFIEMELPVGKHRIVVKYGGREASEAIVIRRGKKWTGTITVAP